MTSIFIFKLLFIFTYFSSIYSANQITYTIDVHTIKTDEPYKALFLEEVDDLLITCGQENIQLKDLKTYNKSEGHDATVLSNPFRLTFRSIFHNGNIIVCGGKSEETGEEMSGVVRLLTVLNKPFYNSWLSCKDKDYCQNHGQCYLDPDNQATKICVCSSYFGGVKCQTFVAGNHLITDHVVVPKTVTDANTITFLIIVFLMTLGLIFFGGLALWYRHNHKQEQKLRRLLVCSECNNKRCGVAKTEDETQTPDGNTNTNNHKEYNRLPQNGP